MVAAQGGDADLVDKPEGLPTATIQHQVLSPVGGWVTEIDTKGIGAAALLLGAGRTQKGESIDLSVGLEVLVKPGEQVEEGQVLAILHGNSSRLVAEAEAAVIKCYSVGEMPKDSLPLVCGAVGRL